MSTTKTPQTAEVDAKPCVRDEIENASLMMGDCTNRLRVVYKLIEFGDYKDINRAKQEILWPSLTIIQDCINDIGRIERFLDGHHCEDAAGLAFTSEKATVPA